MSNYLNRKPNGEPLPYEKSPDLAGLCDEELKELPEFDAIPDSLILIAVVSNGGFEAAMVCDMRKEWERVKHGIANPADTRPLRLFLIKREWVRQMADKPLRSDMEAQK